MQLTSCSADWPPKRTTRWIRSSLTGIEPTVPFGPMRFWASDVAAADRRHGCVGPDVDVDGASFDSRSVPPGQLFVPIVAERDGHDFIGRGARPPARRRT